MTWFRQISAVSLVTKAVRELGEAANKTEKEVAEVTEQISGLMTVARTEVKQATDEMVRLLRNSAMRAIVEQYLKVLLRLKKSNPHEAYYLKRDLQNLAEMIKRMGGELGYNLKLHHVDQLDSDQLEELLSRGI